MRDIRRILWGLLPIGAAVWLLFGFIYLPVATCSAVGTLVILFLAHTIGTAMGK